VAAVASSSSAEKTQQFLDKLNLSCAGYSSYEELVADSNVDAVYVGTPHSHHFQHVMLALEAGKHVLCEKPLTVNANQAKILCEEARKRKLFLMEAVWTRYLPLTIDIVDKIRQGTIGEVLRVIADTSFGDEVEKTWGTEHRMLNKDLAGGALLDRELIFQIHK
jgi:predicted dehydrogenase